MSVIYRYILILLGFLPGTLWAQYITDVSAEEKSKFNFYQVGDFYDGLACATCENKFGFIDSSANVIIPFKYDFANNFTLGYAAVAINGKYGFINTKGQIVIPLKYQNAYSFNRYGLAQVLWKDKWGMIDTTGNVILPFNHEEIGGFNHGISVIKKRDTNSRSYNYLYGAINERGEEILPVEYQYISYFWQEYARVGKNNKTTCVDTLGNLLFPLKYNEVKSPFSGNTLIFARLNKKWGIVDHNGNEKVPLIYDNIEHTSYRDSIFVVCLNKKYGYINISGEELTPVIYDQVMYYFQNRMTAVKLGDKWGTIDVTGKIVCPLVCNSEQDTRRAYIRIQENGLYGIINNSGKILTRCCYEEMDVSWDYKYAFVKQGKWGIINVCDEIIQPLMYDSIQFLRSRQLILLKQDGLYGLANKFGKTIIIPCLYEEIDLETDSEHIMVKKDGKWGIIDMSHNTILPIMYDDIIIGRDRWLLLKLDSLWGAYNMKSQETIPFVYQQINSLVYCSKFETSLAVAQKGNKYGVITSANKVMLPFIYDSIQSYFDYSDCFFKDIWIYSENGDTLLGRDYSIKVRIDNKWGFVDTTGKEHCSMKYDFVGKFENNYYGNAVAIVNGKYGTVNERGEEVIPIQYDSLYFFENTGNDNSYALAKQKGKYGYVSKENGKILVACKYNELDIFSEGLAAARLNKKWGYVDIAGKIIIPFLYDYAHSFANGVASVYIGRQGYFINRQGKTIGKIEEECP